MRLDRERTALIVIDMQNAFCRDAGSIARIGFDIAQCRESIAPCVRLVEAARAARVPVIYTRLKWRADYADGGVLTQELIPGLAASGSCADGSWDAELIDEFVPLPGEFVIDKNRYSAFIGTPLEAILSSLDIRSVVICGVTTNVCVESTARDAGQRDYRTFVVSDATGEIVPERKAWALATLDTRFGRVLDTAAVLQAWAPAG